MSMEGVKSYDDEHEGFAARYVACNDYSYLI